MVQDRRALFVGMCLTMTQLLRRAARRYEAIDAEAFDQLVYRRMLGMVSINELDREQLVRRLKALRATLREEQSVDESAGKNLGGPAVRSADRKDAVLMAVLPLLGDDEGEAPRTGGQDASSGEPDASESGEAGSGGGPPDPPGTLA